MSKLTLKLETVTPLFLGGAEPRGAPELRPPAFRGAMRYWLRAALGGVIGDENLTELHRLESAVFGAADEKIGAAAINLRLLSNNLPAPQPFTQQSRQQPTGHDYLYWSMSKMGRQLPKKFYSPSSQFGLVLQTRMGVENADSKLEYASAALWLLLQLGGIGSRARRTGGSLRGIGKTDKGLSFDLAGGTVPQVGEQLGHGLVTIRKQVESFGSINPHRPSKFDVLHPSTARIWVLGMWSGWNQAVNEVGEALRDFRSRREPDHRNVARWLNGETIPTVERAAFGLPLMYRYSNGPSATVQGRTKSPSIDRRSSPLWLKVSKTTEGKYVVVATLFNSEFLARGEMLHAKSRGNTQAIAPPKNYDLIVEWIESQFSGGSEVSYA